MNYYKIEWTSEFYGRVIEIGDQFVTFHDYDGGFWVPLVDKETGDYIGEEEVFEESKEAWLTALFKVEQRMHELSSCHQVMIGLALDKPKRVSWTPNGVIK